MKVKAILTSGPVEKTLIRLTAPMLVGLFSIMAFNLTDTYFVSRLGTDALAALSFTFPVVMVVGSVALGLGTGAASVISNALGAGDTDRTRRLTTDGLVLSVSIVVLISLAGVLTIDPLFTALGAKARLLPIIRSYMTIWYVGMVFMVVPMVGHNAIRATGDTFTPAIIMVVGAGLNIALDPLLIFGMAGFPRMGVAGAALATVFARSVTLTAALYVLHFRKGMLDFHLPTLSRMLTSWKDILHIGLPAAGTYLLGPLSMAVFTRLVSRFGHEAVAAVGAGTRVEGLAIIVVWALASALVPFAGQNWGAGLRDRVALGFRRSAQFSVVWGLVCLVVFVVLSKPLAGIFSNDPAVLSKLGLHLRVVPLGFGLLGVSILAGNVFNAIRYPMHSVILSALRLFGLFLPMAYLGSVLWDFPGLIAGVAVANAIGGIIAWAWMRFTLASHAKNGGGDGASYVNCQVLTAPPRPGESNF